MRARVFVVILATLFLIGGIPTISFAYSGNLLIIERGPITLSKAHPKATFNFEVPSEYLEGCVYIHTFIGTKLTKKGGSYGYQFSINGQNVNGGGVSGEYTSWHISGSGIDIDKVHAGTNQAVVEAVEHSSYGGASGFDCQAGGIVLFFSKDKDEDVGLLDYINYGETPVPDEIESKKSFPGWAYGIIHEHTTFSDGSYSVKSRVEQAKKLGYDYICLTDHYAQLDKPLKAPGTYYKNAVSIEKPSVGLANYVERCKKACTDDFAVIAGAEFSNPWHSDPKTANFAHTLFVGNVSKTDAILKAEGKEGKQAELISAIEEVGGLAVAAHPNLVSKESVSTRPWEGVRFKYDTRSPEKYSGLNGIEIGNTISKDQDDADMAFFMQQMTAHLPVFPTSGCDSHGWGDKEDDKRMKRITGIFTEDLKPASLVYAVSQGQTFAAIEGVRIKSCNITPSFFTHFVREAQFSLTLSNLPSKVICQMYRDGKPVEKSKIMVSPNKPNYVWTDNDCPDGGEDVWYNFRVLPNYLITGPIIIHIE